jgi:hypothetical protein
MLLIHEHRLFGVCGEGGCDLTPIWKPRWAIKVGWITNFDVLTEDHVASRIYPPSYPLNVTADSPNVNFQKDQKTLTTVIKWIKGPA